jgi:hypothetical protein
MYATDATRRWTIAVMAVALLATATPAVGQQNPEGTSGHTSGQSTLSTDSRLCFLTRIGTQFVRCDNLTGAGAPAPAWVPES